MIDPTEIVAWLRGRTGAHGGGFTSADDVADAIEREFVTDPSVTRVRDNLITTRPQKAPVPDLMAALEESLREVAINRALRETGPTEPSGTCVIHGDYWTPDCERCGR